MNKCPKCKEEINHFAVKVIQTGFEYSLEGFEETQKDESCVYQCPECFEELFYDEYSARDFLKGK